MRPGTLSVFTHLTLSWGASGMYVGWGGVGKFTHPCYLLKYLPKLHQTWHFCCTSDKDQKNIYEFLVFVMTSSYFIDDVIKISDFEGQQENQCNFPNFFRKKLVDPSNES